MRRLFGGAVAALLAMSGVACSGDGGGAQPAGPVAQAAEAVDEAGTARVEMTVEIELGDQTVGVDSEGEIDFANDKTSLTTRTDGGNGMPSVGAIEMIVDGDYMYLKGAAFETILEGAEWGRVDLDESGSKTSQFSQDPTQYLAWLRGAGEDVEAQGDEDIDGTATTRYSVDLHVDDVIAAAGDEDLEEQLRQSFAVFGDVETIPLDVWIDDEGLPRRMHVLLESGEGAQELKTDTTIDFFDFGADVEIEPPAEYKDIASPLG